jgi:DNA invertase Pin-like site-specific DNA recombinase
MTKFIAYYRVSTDKQGKSGLGLEAQRIAVLAHLNGSHPVAEFTEVESGGRKDRPQLQAALAACRRHKARLIIAKLDRLSRSVAFISALLEAGVDFVACDMPMANKLTIHILAAVAEHEREMISARTKAALAAAKRRGVRLGSPRPEVGAAVGRARGASAMALQAQRLAIEVLPVIAEIRRAGTVTLSGVAAALNERGIVSARGGTWSASTVARVLARGQLIGSGTASGLVRSASVA